MANLNQDKGAGDSPSGKASHLGTSLQELSADYVAAVEAYGEAAALSKLASSGSGLTVIDGYVVIDAIADPGMADSLLADLQDLGLEYGAAFGRVVSGLIPLSSLASLDGVEGLTLATASTVSIQAGDVTTQGDAALNADDARAQFGLDGDGVSVGVLSDSFNNLNGQFNDVASGDLPKGIINLEDFPPSSDDFPGTDEGRGMAQLIHDIAPGADILFHTAFLGQANYAQGIIDLAQAGADIIVDDVLYLGEPMFADGIIAQAVNSVVEGGAVYFSSAGNNGHASYEAAYRGVRVNPDSITTDADFTGNANSTFHDFDPGAGVDVTQNYRLADGDEFRISFQWDQPFASTSNFSPGSASDYDIWLINTLTGEILDSSLSNNIGADPIEVISYENDTGQTLQIALVIEKFDDKGPDASLIKFVGFGDSRLIEDQGENSNPTSYGHSIAEGAIGVGASAFFNTPAFGNDPAVINGFSSVGGVPILFDEFGNRLAEPVIREQPAIVAPDGGNTTFFGSDSGADSDNFPNFFGTSAAAPSAAAVAALLLEANPDLSAEQIRMILEDTARDMDDPSTPGFDIGYDLATGYGLIDAQAAIAAALGVDGDRDDRPDVQDPDNTITGTEQREFLIGTSGNDLIEGLDGKDRLDGRDGSDTLLGGDDNDTLLGRGGDDFLDGGAEKDTLRGGAGNDRLTDLEGDNILDGGAGNDSITGGMGRDFAFGRDGSDVISGGGGNDNLRGQAGDDTLTGGQGRDILIGGGGADLFIYEQVSDSTVTPQERDTILGFRGGQGDLIDLSAIDADPAIGADDAFVIVSSFSGQAGELVFFESAIEDAWRVKADIDGDGAPDFEILVNAPVGMSADDFIL